MKKNRSDRGKPHVISGHAGFKEGPDAEYVGDSNVATLDSWVIAAVSDHDDQKKRYQTFHSFQEIFRGRVDDDIVHAVLAECEWQGEEAIERLLELFPSTDENAILPEKKPQFTLRAVAESWLRNTSSGSVSELTQTDAPSPAPHCQWAPLSKGNPALEKTLPISTHHSAAYSDCVDVLNSGHLREKSSVSKLRDPQPGVPDFSVQNKASLAHGSLSVNDPFNIAANNSLLQTGPQGSFAYEPSLELLVDRNDIYFSDDDEALSDATCDMKMQPAVNMNSDWSLYSHFVQPDSKTKTRYVPYGSGLDVGASNPVPPSQGLSAEQVRYLLSTPASVNCHKDLGNKDFIMPHLPVQVRNSPTELRSMRLRSPVCSPQKLDAMPAMPPSMFTPRSLFNPTVGLTSLEKPGGKTTSVTIMSTEAAKRKVLELLRQNLKVMILMRGCPGSGKTTLAREVQFNGLILSADDFFEKHGKYKYDPARIGDAHAQAKQRALFAVKKGVSPVIIDNTNTQAWEMLAYVEMAVDYDYHVEVIEPDVSWRLKATQLARHTVHGVPPDKVAAMVERYEHNLTAKKLLDAVHSQRRQLVQSPAVSHLAASSLPQSLQLLTQPPPLRQPHQPQLLMQQTHLQQVQPQQLLMQSQQLPMQPSQVLMQPPQLLMQPPQLLMQTQSSVQTQATQKEEELEKKTLSKSARKRRHRQVKKHAAGAVAAAACASNEDESRLKEVTSTRSDAGGSNKQDLIQHLDDQVASPGFATPLGSPSQSNFESYEDELVPAATESIVWGDSESGENTQLQLDFKDSTKDNIWTSENSSGVLPQTTAPEESGSNTASVNCVSSEMDLSVNQFCSDDSQIEQRPDLEICEVEEIEVLSSGSISPPEEESSSVSSPLRSDNRNEVHNLSSIGDVDSLNCSSHCNALNRFAESAEVGHAMRCVDSQVVKDSDNLSRNPLLSTTTSSVELDYWSEKGAIDNPYSIHGAQKDNHSSVTGVSSWSEQDSGDSVNVTGDDCSNRSMNPKPQRNLKERKTAVKKTADTQTKVAGIESDSSFCGKTSDLNWHDVMLTPLYLVSPPPISRIDELPKKASQEGASQTEASDLAAVYRLDKGEHFDASLFSCILTATPRAIIDRELAILSQMVLDTKILAVSKRNVSTMTDDLDDEGIDAKMMFLSSCFPTVTHDDLHYILHGCGNDTDLTANILLDSGYEYNKPNESAVGSCKAPSTVPSSDGEALPVRPTPSDIQRKVGVRLSRAPVSYTLCRDSVKPKVLPSVESTRGRRDKGQGAGRAQESCDSPGLQQLSLGDEKISMSLTPGFAAQLVDLFGPLQSSSPFGLMPDSGLSVNLSFELAKQIYDSWMVTQNEMKTSRRKMTNIISSGSSQAQASAAWMADTCNLISTNSFEDLDSLSEFTNKPQQMKSARDDSESFPALNPRRPMKTTETKANNLSTKIKRQQLAERYPMINSTILDEIYEATGFSYDITVKTIACCPELIAPPKVVMTKKKAEELELQLIERAIEESVRDQISKGARKAVRNTDCDEVYEDIMSEACRYFNRYQDNLQKAQDAHCKKLHPVAMHYSDEASLYKDKFRETKQMAAEMIMKNRLSDLSNRDSIDLHGFSVREALLLLQQSLSLHEDELLERYDKRRAFLNVITGRGSHSHRKVARIKPAVEAYLARNNYDFVESTSGVLKVRLHVGF